MDAHAEQSTVHDARISPDTQRHADYVSPDTDSHSHASILNKEQMCRMYPECFIGIGKFKYYECHKPVVHPVRKTAIVLRSKLQKELQNMVEQGITVPVGDGESDWVDSPVIRERPDGSLCICFVPRDLKSLREKTIKCP